MRCDLHVTMSTFLFRNHLPHANIGIKLRKGSCNVNACQEPVHIYFNFFLKARYANFRFVYHTERKITRNFPSPIWIQMLSNFLLDLYIILNICFTLPKTITRGTSLTITVLRKLWILDVLVKKVITTCYTFSVSIIYPAILVRAYKLNCFLILARNPELSLWRRADARNFSFETLHGGQFTLSTQLIILNYPVIFSF